MNMSPFQRMFLEVVFTLTRGQLPSLLFCMPLHSECLMHQILICHSFILDSSFILWVMWLTGEMCCTSAVSAEICYLWLKMGFWIWLSFALHHKFWQTNLKCSNNVFFLPAVARYCMPVAVIPLSCILISVLTVNIWPFSLTLPVVSISHFLW